MKWSELDTNLIVQAACIAVDQRGVPRMDFFERKLKVNTDVAYRLIKQLVELKIISNTPNNHRAFFSTRHTVETYLKILSELGEFTQADIDRFDFMRSNQHWQNYDDEVVGFMDEKNPIKTLDEFYRNLRKDKYESLKHFHPQLAFKRSVYQRILYSTWAVGAIRNMLALLLVVFMVDIDTREPSLQVGDLHANPFLQIGLLIVASIFWQPDWKKHLKSPIELYWVGDHFEAVFPDGTLDRKPDLSKVLFYDKKTQENGWVSLRPTSKYIGANWVGLKECHQAWMDAQKEE